MRRLGILLILSLCGCATTQSRTTSDGWSVRAVPAGKGEIIVQWRGGAPGSGWLAERSRTSDFSWTHAGLGATIYGDSTCGERYDDVPLTVLVNHLTFGFEGTQTVSQTELELTQRAALRRVFTARLDGREVQVASTVVKHGPCIFDLVYLTVQPDRFDEGLPAYEAVTAGLVVRVGP